MRHFLCRAASPVFVKFRGMSAIRINVNIARGKKTPSKLKALNLVNCSEIRGAYKMFYQQSFSHNLVSFRRAYQCYCQPCKKGTFLLKRALFLIILKVGGPRAPSATPPPSYAPDYLNTHICNPKRALLPYGNKYFSTVKARKFSNSAHKQSQV